MKKLWLIALVAVVAITTWLLLRKRGDDRPAEPTAPPIAHVPQGTQIAPVARPDRHKQAQASIAGTTRDLDGAPVAGARVCIFDANALACSVSDTAGAYQLALAPGDYDAWATSPAHVADEATGYLAPGEHATGVDFVLVGGAVELRGVVEDFAGGAVPRAFIRVTNGMVATVGAPIQTGDDGKFSVWVLPDPVTVHASAEGYSPTDVVTTPPGPVVILLAPESAIHGRVVDEHGEPLAKAKVWIAQSYPEIATQTDGRGRFSLAPLGPQSYALEAALPGHHAYSERDIALGIAEQVTDVVLRATPAHQVALRLLDETGAPCKRPRASLHTPGHPVPDGWRDGALLRYDGIAPGRYAVEGSCGDGDRGTPFPSIDVGDRDVAIDLRMAATGATLSGVVTLDGKPLHGINVQLTREHGTPFAMASRADGSYELHVPPGHYRLDSYNYRDFDGPPDEQLDIVAGANHRDLAFKRSQRGTVTGTLVDAQHAPIPHAQVWIGEDARALGASMTTDANGAYTASVRPGHYQVMAFGAPVDADVKADEVTRVDLVAKHTGKITGRVVDDDRHGIQGAYVVSLWLNEMIASTVTDASGGFELSSSQGTDLSAFRIGEAPTRFRDPLKQTGIEIVLHRLGSIDGTVTNADGSPADAFSVEVRADGDLHTMQFDRAHGAFHLSRVLPGATRLRAIRGGEGAPVELTIAPGQALTGVALTLPPSVDLALRILDAADRTPIANAKVDFSTPRGTETLWLTHDDQRSDAAGVVTIRGAPLGDAMLEVAPPPGYARAKQAVHVEASMAQIDILVTRTR